MHFKNLSPWPDYLLELLYRSQKFLSPLSLQTNLGHTQSYSSSNNPYSTYYTLIGQMNVTRNPRAIALYSRTIGVFLESSDIQANTGHNLDLLCLCQDQLLANNAIFSRYNIRSELQLLLLPLATLYSKEKETQPLNIPNLVLNPKPYTRETQDKDYHYSQLLVALVSTRSSSITGLLRSDLDIELLLFPVLYSRDEGNWKPACPKLQRPIHNTFLQYIKIRINGILSHYYKDHYYPFQAYQEIEA